MKIRAVAVPSSCREGYSSRSSRWRAGCIPRRHNGKRDIGPLFEGLPISKGIGAFTGCVSVVAELRRRREDESPCEAALTAPTTPNVSEAPRRARATRAHHRQGASSCSVTSAAALDYDRLLLCPRLPNDSFLERSLRSRSLPIRPELSLCTPSVRSRLRPISCRFSPSIFLSFAILMSSKLLLRLLPHGESTVVPWCIGAYEVAQRIQLGKLVLRCGRGYTCG